MALADYTRDKLLSYLFGNGSYSTLSSYYYGLTNGLLQHNGNNIADVEVTGGGYQRLAYGNIADINWTHISSGESTLAGAFGWTATSNWGLVTHFFISENAIEGDGSQLIYVGELQNPKKVLNGDYIAFYPGGITVGVD